MNNTETNSEVTSTTSSTVHKSNLRSYDSYNKLRSKGMPEDLIKRKMMYDGINHKDINDFFSSAPTNTVTESKLISKNSRTRLSRAKSVGQLRTVESNRNLEYFKILREVSPEYTDLIFC